MYLLLALLIGGSVYVLRNPELRQQTIGFFYKSEADYSSFVTKTLEKDAFKVTVEAKGTVDSSRNSSLINSVEGQTTIISIVPAGTMVQEPLRAQVDGVVKEIQNLSSRTPTIVLIDEEGKEHEHPYEMSVYSEVLVAAGDTVKYDEIMIGDLVCELDASSLIDAEKQQQISVTQADADLKKSNKNVEIQEAQNESDIAAANLAMKLAKLDLTKYTEGEYIQEKERIQGEIKQAEAELKQAQDELKFKMRLEPKGYATPDEVKVADINVLKSQLQLNVKNKELEVLEKYTKERTIEELLEMAEESKRELVRVKLAGEAALAQYQAEVTSQDLSYNVQKSQLDRLRTQIKACKLIAPQAGQVVYANQASRREQPVVIEEGATVRERQTIINLPDMSAMKVDAKIHESKISDVVQSLPVLIRVDAIPGHVYTGILESVSSVPLPGNWPNLDLKQYEAVVKILDQGDILNQLKPGMTANVEIIVDESTEKLLQVPVQAAVDIGRGYYAWVLTEDGPEMRELKLGRSNDVKFVVQSGLKEGEDVIMNPRTHFAEQIAKLEAEAIQKNQKNRFDRAGRDGESTSADAPSGGSTSGPGRTASTENGQRPPGGGQGFDPTAFFAKQDQNGDGELEGNEIPDRMKDGIARMDSDKNGKISKEEFLAARQQSRPGAGPEGGPRNGGGGPGRPPRNGGTRGAE